MPIDVFAAKFEVRTVLGVEAVGPGSCLSCCGLSVIVTPACQRRDTADSACFGLGKL